MPGQQEGLVPRGLPVEPPTLVDGDGLLEIAAQMVDQAHTPGEPRRKLVRIRGTRVPGERVLPLPPDLARPSGQQHDRSAQRSVGEELRVPDDRVDGAGREHRLPALGEQSGELVVRTRCGERAEGVVDEALGLQPCGRAGEKLRLVGERHALACELAHQRSERVPARLAPVGLDEEPAALERGERLGSADGAESLAELRVEAVERGHRPHERAHVLGLALEDLARKIGEEAAAGPPEAVERAAPLLGRDVAEGLQREPDCRGPPAARLLEVAGDVVCRLAQRLLEQKSRLVGGEGKLARGELDDLALPAQALDREGRLVARGQDDVQRRRRVPHERLDEP